MHLSESDIRHLADLARLHVSDEEAERLSHDLTEIVRFIDDASREDVSNRQPGARPSGPPGALRKDVAHTANVGRSAEQSSQTEDGFVRVPPVRGPHQSAESGDGASE